MDLDYEKYIPKEYLLDDFDASPDNPYQEMVTNGNYHANDFAVTLYGLSAYNKSELISQNGADFNSNFEMFPDSIKEFADGQSVSKMNLDTDDSFEYTILRIKYSEMKEWYEYLKIDRNSYEK